MLKNIFKKYFLSGLVIIVPLIGTYLILKFLILSVDGLFISLLPSGIQPQKLFGREIPGLGLIATILLILAAGALTRQYVGSRLINLGDRIIAKIPLGRSIYNGIKQLMETMFSRKKQNFQRVVVVQYPRSGCWMMGFVTRNPGKHILDVDKREWVTVFIPTTPNPTSGFLAMVPEEDTRHLSMTTEEAFKFIISGGFVQNEKESRDMIGAQPL